MRPSSRRSPLVSADCARISSSSRRARSGSVASAVVQAGRDALVLDRDAFAGDLVLHVLEHRAPAAAPTAAPRARLRARSVRDLEPVIANIRRCLEARPWPARPPPGGPRPPPPASIIALQPAPAPRSPRGSTLRSSRLAPRSAPIVPSTSVIEPRHPLARAAGRTSSARPALRIVGPRPALVHFLAVSVPDCSTV